MEGIEEYEQGNLYHADLHSNATAHFKAAERQKGTRFIALQGDSKELRLDSEISYLCELNVGPSCLERENAYDTAATNCACTSG